MSHMREGLARTSLSENVKWGLGWGVFMGCFYSAFAVLILFTRGPQAFSSKGASFAGMIAVYIIGGIVAGCFLGILRPITRYFVGALIAAILVSVPPFAGLLMATSGTPLQWSRNTWLTLILLTCIVAPIFGGATWYRARNRERR